MERRRQAHGKFFHVCEVVWDSELGGSGNHGKLDMVGILKAN